jgi:hypothetical protein
MLSHKMWTDGHEEADSWISSPLECVCAKHLTKSIIKLNLIYFVDYPISSLTQYTILHAIINSGAAHVTIKQLWCSVRDCVSKITE